MRKHTRKTALFMLCVYFVLLLCTGCARGRRSLPRQAGTYPENAESSYSTAAPSEAATSGEAASTDGQDASSVSEASSSSETASSASEASSSSEAASSNEETAGSELPASTGSVREGLYIDFADFDDIDMDNINNGYKANGYESFLVVKSVNPFSAWYEDFEGVIPFYTIIGNKASRSYNYDYGDEGAGTISDTVEFNGEKANLTVSETSMQGELVWKRNYEYTWLRETYLFTDAQTKQMAHDLGVPDELDVKITQGSPYYWDGGGQWLLQVDVYSTDGQYLAGAAFDFLTCEMVSNIYIYSAP